MNIEDIGIYVKYHEEYGVLRCISHKYGMTSGDGIGRHLQIYHKSIPIDIRNKIIEYADGLGLKDAKDIRPPNPEAGPIEGFEIFENGFKCIFEDCPGYYSAKESTMKKHSENKHKCHEKKWVHQTVQTFFPGIPSIYYTNASTELHLFSRHDASRCYSDCNGCTD
jgi:Orsellinic acid/F9775 biosynthesis cluster protein D